MPALHAILVAPAQQGHYGHVYNFHQAVVQQPPPTIEGMFSIYGAMGRIMFDMGALNSFIASRFALAIGLLDLADNTVTYIDLPMGSGMLIFFICRSVSIKIGSLILSANLLVLDMLEYDVIIDMDWLVAYRSMIDFYIQCIIFSIPGHEMFIVAMPRSEGGSFTH